MSSHAVASMLAKTASGSPAAFTMAGHTLINRWPQLNLCTSTLLQQKHQSSRLQDFERFNEATMQCMTQQDAGWLHRHIALAQPSLPQAVS